MAHDFQPGERVAWSGVPLYRDGEGIFVGPAAPGCGRVVWPYGGRAIVALPLDRMFRPGEAGPPPAPTLPPPPPLPRGHS